MYIVIFKFKHFILIHLITPVIVIPAKPYFDELRCIIRVCVSVSVCVCVYIYTHTHTREGWNFNFGNGAVTFDTVHLQSSYFHRPSMYSPKLCRTRSQR